MKLNIAHWNVCGLNILNLAFFRNGLKTIEMSTIMEKKSYVSGMVVAATLLSKVGFPLGDGTNHKKCVCTTSKMHKTLPCRLEG